MQRFTFHLIFYPLIAIFWLIMWALLLRSELRPQDASLREVPVEHVARLIFREKQSSDLALFENGARVGTLQIIPSVPSENRCAVDFVGTVQMRLPDGARERIRWNGEFTTDNAFTLQLLHLVFTSGPTQDGLTVEITVNPVEHTASYVSRSQGRVMAEQAFTPDQSGLARFAESLGIDPGILQAASFSRASAPRITAHQSSLQIHHEKVDTYLVTVEFNGQTMLGVQVSQIGVVLEATTALGWSLESQ